MKKIKFISSVVLSAVVMASFAPNVLGATSKPIPTKGRVEFKTVGEGEEGEVTKPDTEEEIIVPEGGNHTTGPLRITYVPDFDFGKVEIETKTKEVPAIFNKFRETDATGAPIEPAKEIAHFAQVEDIRGKKADWQLSVKSSKFIPTKATNKPLEKSHIVLKEAKLFNTSKQSEITNLVSSVPENSAINNDNKTALEIMATKTGQHTDSSKTSLVFNKGYTHNDLTAGAIPPAVVGEGNLNPGVQLKAYGTDEKAVDDTYTATLTWTLTSAL